MKRTFEAKFSSPDVACLPTAPAFDLSELHEFVISRDRIGSILSSLNAHKACGPDNISSRIILECAEQLTVPLTMICKLSVKQGVFPTKWKEANVVPVFKKGSRKLPENYRAVSLLPLFGKVLERAVYEALFQHVRPVLSDKQHGFLPRRSCDTNLACLLASGWQSIARGIQTDVIYTDYTAAFQSVNHRLLLHKLNYSYGLKGVALNWFKSFLSDRKQRVVVNGKCSAWERVTSGTPEGSLCSPLLFALFINDLPSKIKTNCLMFADDVKLYAEVSKHDDAAALQADLDSLCTWSRTWKLSLNPGKCKSFTMTLKRRPITFDYAIEHTALEQVDVIRDLGVLLDRKLTFSKHVELIISKANRSLGILMRAMQTGMRSGTLKCEPILTAYYANVRATLEYCCVVWGGAADTYLDRLERVQHRFLIWLAHHVHSPLDTSSLDYDDLRDRFKVTSLAGRRRQYDLMFLRKIFSGRFDSPSLLERFPLHVAPRGIRPTAQGRGVLHVPFSRVNTIKRGMFVRLPNFVNAFLSTCRDADLFHGSLGEYRSKVLAYVKQF